MSDRQMRTGLVHARMGTTDVEFFQAIDATGGWPVGFKYCGFEHTDERDAGFTNSSHNTGYWTVVANADDYYLWKLSPGAIQRIADAAIEATRYIRVDAAKLWIKNSSGHRAEVSKVVQP